MKGRKSSSDIFCIDGQKRKIFKINNALTWAVQNLTFSNKLENVAIMKCNFMIF